MERTHENLCNVRMGGYEQGLDVNILNISVVNSHNEWS